MHLHYGDLTDSTCLVKIISQIRPHEIYNLGAQSHVKVRQLSWSRGVGVGENSNLLNSQSNITEKNLPRIPLTQPPPPFNMVSAYSFMYYMNS